MRNGSKIEVVNRISKFKGDYFLSSQEIPFKLMLFTFITISLCPAVDIFHVFSHSLPVCYFSSTYTLQTGFFTFNLIEHKSRIAA